MINGTSIVKSIVTSNVLNQTLSLYRFYLDGLSFGDTLTLSCVISWDDDATVNSNAMIHTQGPGNKTNWEEGQFPPFNLKPAVLDAMSNDLNSVISTNNVLSHRHSQFTHDYLKN